MTEKELFEKGELLPIMEEFYSIQGEGKKSGEAAYFVRIGGCDVGCHWCDVKESWDPTLHPLKSIQSIVDNIQNCPAQSIVVTGGEPMGYNLAYLTDKLKQLEVQLFLETSGAYKLSGVWDWICVSPKKAKEVREDVLLAADELKIIVYNKHDITWAEELSTKVSADCELFLQPEWSKQDKVIPLIVDYCKENPKWKISIQSHKYMRIP